MNRKILELSSEGKLISKVNPIITNYTKKLAKLRDLYEETKDPTVLKEYKAIRREINTEPSRIRQGTRIYYVRYADD